MTLRAVLLGLAGALVVCGFTYFNDQVIRQTYLVGMNMPTAVYGGLILIVLVVNPLLGRIRRGWQLTGRELAVAMLLTLVACCIPSAGLLETFPNAMMMPHHLAKTEPAWQTEGALDMAPRYMLADVTEDEDRVLNGYVQGLSSGQKRISFGDVPWSAWTRTLAFWLPLLLLLWTGLIALAMVLHQQWSVHERLPYPIAAVTEALLPPEGGARKPVYRTRLFWMGCGAVCFVHLVNYAYAWWPSALVQIPRQVDFSALRELFPTFCRAGGGRLFRFTVYFTIVGLAYFVPKDVSFSMGVGPFFYFLLAGILAGFGITMSGGSDAVHLSGSLQAGAYTGMFLLIMYTGRRYYANVFCTALGLRPTDDVEPQAVWGARIFLACALLVIVILTAAGIDWQLSILFTALLVMAFVVIGRISAGTGHLFTQVYGGPVLIMMGVMGSRAIGPSTALLLFLVSTVLILDTREALTPFILNAYKVLSERESRLRPVVGLSVLALLVGLAVAVPVTLYVKYDRGTNLAAVWASRTVPRGPFDKAMLIKQRLRAQGRLENAESLSGWRRLLAFSPSRTFLAGFGSALCVFLLLSAARLRFTSWPLHPVMLLVWNTFGGWKFCASFLVGCFVKWAVVKYGGDRTFQQLKPVMVGLIAGDMLIGITTSIIGGIYYLVTGTPPPRFAILVG